jgi:SAM-dependent methyltransferase
MAAYKGLCTLCGTHSEWVTSADANLRDNYSCSKCKAGLRYRNQAAAVVNYFGRGIHATLRDLVRDERFSQSAVYEIALRGPFIKYFSHWKQYTQSFLWPDTPLGQTKQGIRSEDITKLTFGSSSFDLIISSDVLEHVFDFETAFAELFRVLKPGGYHIFTTPLSWPIPKSTVKRASESDGRIDHHLPPRFHVGGDNTPSLVCTDFGSDLLDLLSGLGYNASFTRPSVAEHPHYRDAVIVTQRPRELSEPSRGRKK